MAPPLEAICLKAMALRPEDRYPTPRALAQDIERWIADEPVSAYPEPWRVRARRWAKRHRTLVTSSAAALIVAVIGLAVLAVAINAARQRVSKLNSQLTAANERLDRANTNLAQSNASLAKALKDVEAANTTANERLDQTMEAIRDYYTGISEDVLLGRDEFRDLREKLVAKPLKLYETMTRQLEATPNPDERSRRLLAEGRFDLARILGTMGRHDASQKQDLAAIAAYEELVAAQPGVPEYQHALAGSYNNLGLTLQTTGNTAGAIEA